MWWRALGVGLVLLGVGLAGGYALADRNEPGPGRVAGTAAPLPAQSPSVPTPTIYPTLPDPSAPPLLPDLPNHPEELRITKRGAGISLVVPDGWINNRLENSNTWNFVPEVNVTNTYVLRANLMLGQRLAATVAKQTRLNALQSAADEGNLKDLQISAETDDSFVASYIDIGGYRRLTMEHWIADESGTAIADIAVTGRLVDEEGMGDLLARVSESVAELDPLPPKPSSSESP